MTLDLHHLRLQDWRHAIASGDFQRGRAYADEERAQNLRFEAGELLAECRGSGWQRYRQRIRLIERAGRWDVDGRCNCPVGYNCKHVVAALLTLERLQQAGQRLPGSDAPAPQVVELPARPPRWQMVHFAPVRVQ